MSDRNVAVLFDCKDDVLQAYKNMNCPAWALFTGSELNFSYSGNDMKDGEELLVGYLEMLGRNERMQYYRLQVYDIDPGQKINNKTPYTGSFKFTLSGISNFAELNGLNDLTVGHLIGNSPVNKLLLNEIRGLKLELAEIKKKENSEDDEDDDGFGLGKIGKVLAHPTIAPVFHAIMGKLVQFIPTPNQQPGGPVDDERKIAGIPAQTISANDIDERIDNALEAIAVAVPDFPIILEKLAQLAKVNPKLLVFYCEQIRAMQFE